MLFHNNVKFRVKNTKSIRILLRHDLFLFVTYNFNLKNHELINVIYVLNCYDILIYSTEYKKNML